MRSYLLAPLFVAMALMSGCGSPGAENPSADVLTAFDAGTSPDADTSFDAGTSPDAALSLDAGTSPDAGTSADAGAPSIALSEAGVDLENGATLAFPLTWADGEGSIASEWRTLTIENRGSAALAITSIGRPSGDNYDFPMDVTEVAMTLAPGAFTTLKVRFDPLFVGARSSQMVVLSDDPEQPTYTLMLSGEGGLPAIAAVQGATAIPDGTGTFAFAPVLADGNGGATSEPVVFTVENQGNFPLTIGQVELIGTDAASWDLDSSGISSPVAAGGSCSFSLRFDPLVVGARSASVRISSNDPLQSAYVFSLTGVGAGPSISVRLGSTEIQSGGEIALPVADVDGYGEVELTIANTGVGELVLSGNPMVELSGPAAADFSVETPPSSPIAASGQTTFKLRFTPSAVGTSPLMVRIPNNSAAGTFVFTVEATAIDGIWLFRSQNKHTGDLGGRAGADATCQAAYDAGHGGFGCSTVKAFIGVSSSDRLSDLGAPAGREVRTVAGVQIETSWARLWDGDDLLADFSSVLGSENWWSGSKETGEVLQTCGGWTHGGSSNGGTIGGATTVKPSTTAGGWAWAGSSICFSQYYLLCACW